MALRQPGVANAGEPILVGQRVQVEQGTVVEQAVADELDLAAPETTGRA